MLDEIRDRESVHGERLRQGEPRCAAELKCRDPHIAVEKQRSPLGAGFSPHFMNEALHIVRSVALVLSVCRPSASDILGSV